MTIREITLADYDALIPFWKKNYFINVMDSKDHFELFLEKNPHLSLLAEENGVILGTALGSFDGRRGYIQKVVVDGNQRKKGIGKQLVTRVLENLHNVGAAYVRTNASEENIHFYELCGFKKTNSVPMNTEMK
jgi:putative acetyltransferase